MRVRRPILVVALAVVVALAALAVVGIRVLERDRRALYAGYARDRLAELEASGHAFADEITDVDKDLQLAVALFAQAETPREAERELHAIATIKREYEAMATRTTRVVAFDAAPEVTPLANTVLTAGLERAEATPGRLRISPPLGTSGPALWYRVFSRQASSSEPSVAVIVDLAIMLGHSRLLPSPDDRLLVVAGGQVAPPSNLPLAAQDLHDTIPADRAAAFGLARTTAVAVTAPLQVDEGAPWKLLLVSSTSVLEHQEETLVRRVLVGGAFVLVLLLGAAGYVVHATRRTATLEERLRHVQQQRRYEEQLLHSEKLATAGQLAAGIAHEIGTPLGVARGRVELAMAKADDPKHHAIAIDQIDRVTRLIQQLLDYVRPRPADVQDLELADAMHTVTDLLAPQAHGIEIRVTGAGALRADPDQIQQVLINLVLNALDACEKGGHVELRASERMIEVIDDGAGIARELHAQVFDPFFTTKKRGQGTGLGLWVVAQLVRAQGGEIELESAPGAGTTVRVRWPA